MSNVENHMDDLFKRAADNYPLKTSAGDWDKLFPKMEADTPHVATQAGKNSLRKPFFFLLAVFITAGMLSPLFTHDLVNEKVGVASISQKIIAGENVEKPEAIIEKNFEQNSKAEKPMATKENKNAETVSLVKLNSRGNKKILMSLRNHTEPKNTIVENVKTDIPVVESKLAFEIQTDNTVNEAVITKTISDTTAEVQSGQPLQTMINTEDVISEETKQVKEKPKFYLGLSAGIEQSTIKNQERTKAGLNAGIIVGLQINKHWAVESGIQLTQKKYFTEGKFFQPKQGSMPSNMTISDMNGTSTLIEIPVNVKFNFSKKNNTIYVTTGFSSYLLTKEQNKYNAIVTGQQQQINSTYNDMHKYFASMFNLSFGYQHGLNKNTNIRLEPFIQLPLKGIGIGALPVSSSGIHIVITQRKK